MNTTPESVRPDVPQLKPGARPYNYIASYVQRGYRVETDNIDRFTEVGWVRLKHPDTGHAVTVSSKDGKHTTVAT